MIPLASRPSHGARPLTPPRPVTRAARRGDASMPSPHGSAGKFRLFVYGTLKRGGSRHAPLQSQRCLGEAQTTATYALHDLGDYPGLVACSKDGMIVHGELYEVDCSLADWLDAMEGSPAWFKL